VRKSFAEYAEQVRQHLEIAYGIRVVARDIPAPLLADLDGSEIHIDPAVSPEQRLFLLAHLFGHTVQWNAQPGAFELGQRYRPPVDEDDIPAIIGYEREAASYGLELLHRAGILDMDRWFSDYGACDGAYLLHWYRTGEGREFRSFWLDDAPLVKPKPVPPFSPIKRRFRLDGVVI
jgi:hypothetical protein